MKGRKPKAFLDTNVWISAYVFTGNEKKIVEKAINGEFQAVVSDQVIDEFNRIMYKKFDYSKKLVLEAISEIIQISEMANFDVALNLKLKDKDDIAIVNAAMIHDCDYLITGDKGILNLKQVKRTKIVRPREFLEIL